MKEPFKIVIEDKRPRVIKIALGDLLTFKNAFVVSFAGLTAAWVFDQLKKKISKKGE